MYVYFDGYEIVPEQNASLSAAANNPIDRTLGTRPIANLSVRPWRPRAEQRVQPIQDFTFAISWTVHQNPGEM